jgi:hypothetical protein
MATAILLKLKLNSGTGDSFSMFQVPVGVVVLTG